MRESRVEGRVFQHKRAEQGVADEFYVRGRVMPVALNFLLVLEGKVDRIFNNQIVGAILGGQRLLVDRRKPGLEPLIEISRGVQAGGAEIVEFRVQVDALVLVIAGLRGRVR